MIISRVISMMATVILLFFLGHPAVARDEESSALVVSSIAFGNLANSIRHWNSYIK